MDKTWLPSLDRRFADVMHFWTLAVLQICLFAFWTLLEALCPSKKWDPVEML